MMGIVCRLVPMLVLAAGHQQQWPVFELASLNVHPVNTWANAHAGCRSMTATTCLQAHKCSEVTAY